ncbi:MAG: alpha-hydroxyketone-type quorum-sensing autoinducer synthase [Chloroflexota bacterium]
MESLKLESPPNNEIYAPSTPTHTESLCAPFPDFIHDKLAEYHQEFFGQTTDGQAIVVGAAPTNDSILLQSNDYLNISGNPRIANKQIGALAEQKRDLLMSFSFVQDNSVIRRFEKKMADYVGYQNAMLFTSGWTANIGVLEAIADENTNVYIDFFAHMSLWEGIKACSAKPHPFRHNNVVHLERLINQNGPGIIVVDSVYSTLGTICPLVEIADLAEKYGCVFVVDESHSLGLYGPQGAGLVAELNITNKVHFITASLSKAFAGRAGIVLSANDIIVFMPYVCNPAIFSTTLLSHEVVALSATLDLIKESDERRKALHKKATYFREHLIALGYAVSS